jgi:5-formyltetrahydrofolate cyclo-ligase
MDKGGGVFNSSEGAPQDLRIHEAKAALRKQVEERLTSLTPEQRARASAKACQRLERQRVWQKAGFVMFYAPRNDELDVASLLEKALAAGKRAALPQFDRQTRSYRMCEVRCPLSEVPVGYYGIREPGAGGGIISPNQLDLILVPGVAFDLSGRRLGRGRGYYDQLLSGVQAIKCGLCFDEQVYAQIPVEPHDILLNCILTPTRWWQDDPGRLGDDVFG